MPPSRHLVSAANAPASGVQVPASADPTAAIRLEAHMPATDLIVDLAIRYGFQVLGAIVILMVGFALAWGAGSLIERPLRRWALEPPIRQLMVRIVRITVLLFAIVVALDKFGFQIAPFVAGIGVAGLGIGIALQGVLG